MSDIVKSRVAPSLLIDVNNSLIYGERRGKHRDGQVIVFRQKVGKFSWGDGVFEGVRLFTLISK